MRGVPDVALAAANHDGYFMVENGAHWIVSGTSVAAPSFAGLMALVIEKQLGAVQGSANPRLYALSSVESSPFHATPGGNNSVPDVNGFAASGATYNLATGLGSVDGALLMNDWNEKTEPVLIIRPPKSCVQFGSISVRCKPPSRTPILWRMSRSAE
jgi:kumamolisin